MMEMCERRWRIPEKKERNRLILDPFIPQLVHFWNTGRGCPACHKIPLSALLGTSATSRAYTARQVSLGQSNHIKLFPTQNINVTCMLQQVAMPTLSFTITPLSVLLAMMLLTLPLSEDATVALFICSSRWCSGPRLQISHREMSHERCDSIAFGKAPRSETDYCPCSVSRGGCTALATSYIAGFTIQTTTLFKLISDEISPWRNGRSSRCPNPRASQMLDREKIFQNKMYGSFCQFFMRRKRRWGKFWVFNPGRHKPTQKLAPSFLSGG